MEFTAQVIANFLGGVVEGNPEVKVSTVSKIEEGSPGSLAFLANPKYAPYIYTTNASIVLVNADFVAEQPIKATLVRVKNAYEAFASLHNSMLSKQTTAAVWRTPSFIHPSAYGDDFTWVRLAQFRASRIGSGFTLRYLLVRVIIGDNTTIYPGAVIYHECTIRTAYPCRSGNWCRFFGFASQEDANYKNTANWQRSP